MTPVSLQDVFLPQELIKFLDQAGSLGHLWVPLNIPGSYCEPGAIIKVEGFGQGLIEPGFKITPLGGTLKDCYPDTVSAELFKVITSPVPAVSLIQNKKFELDPKLTLTMLGGNVDMGAEFNRVKNVDLEINQAAIGSFDLIKVNAWGRKQENRTKVDLDCLDQILEDNIYVVHEAFTIKGTYTLKDERNQKISLDTPQAIQNFIKIGAEISHSNTTDGKLQIDQPTVIAVRRVARIGRLYGAFVPQ